MMTRTLGTLHIWDRVQTQLLDIQELGTNFPAESQVNVCENYLKKGSKLYIEGQLETRSWEQDGQKKYTTEVVLRPYRGELTMLDSRNGGGASAGGFSDGGQSGYDGGAPAAQQNNAPVDQLEDEIPF